MVHCSLELADRLDAPIARGLFGICFQLGFKRPRLDAQVAKASAAAVATAVATATGVGVVGVAAAEAAEARDNARPNQIEARLGLDAAARWIREIYKALDADCGIDSGADLPEREEDLIDWSGGHSACESGRCALKMLITCPIGSTAHMRPYRQECAMRV